ncbi:hypothetical protein CLV63_12515 [Murinocardiopsis flavida]|uniref:TetR family transcriptional regulator n=1 Tax=Murinocardiopsis flavida TaxID=645275 RepID=A0A2P8CXB2_9ACTN|nr:hypothetical protein [Murinocardiopsis flavida]PSK89621.1 hypothetical protein CLV63_12515 [Murinocardiopsis flavida]
MVPGVIRLRTTGWTASTRAIGQWLGETLAIGRASGAVRDDLPAELQGRLTFAVLRTFDEWTMHRHADLEPAQARALVGAQLDTLKRLLTPTPQP